MNDSKGREGRETDRQQIEDRDERNKRESVPLSLVSLLLCLPLYKSSSDISRLIRLSATCCRQPEVEWGGKERRCGCDEV